MTKLFVWRNNEKGRHFGAEGISQKAEDSNLKKKYFKQLRSVNFNSIKVGIRDRQIKYKMLWCRRKMLFYDSYILSLTGGQIGGKS